MRALTICLLLGHLLLCGFAAAEPPADAGKSASPTGVKLLEQLSSDLTADHQYALGYIMGVFAVHAKQGALPEMANQEKIAAIVKKALESRRDQLDRPASELLNEIYHQERDRLQELMTGQK